MSLEELYFVIAKPEAQSTFFLIAFVNLHVMLRLKNIQVSFPIYFLSIHDSVAFPIIFVVVVYQLSSIILLKLFSKLLYLVPNIYYQGFICVSKAGIIPKSATLRHFVMIACLLFVVACKLACGTRQQHLNVFFCHPLITLIAPLLEMDHSSLNDKTKTAISKLE